MPQLQPFEPMLAELSARGFYFGVDVSLRLHRWIAMQTEKPEGEVSREKIKFALSAMLCHSKEEQAIFFEVFDQYFKEEKTTPTPPEPPKPLENDVEDIEPVPAPPPPLPKPEPEPKPAVEKVASSRKGPIRIELRFPENELRAWNHEPMDRAMQPLREKEWTDTYDWDIPGSIRRTIKAGGIPQFVFQRRKKTPAYLVLIEQRSARDHLAGFYREMVLEMNRRDIDAGYYFFDNSPHLVWKERNTIHRRIPIERLAGEFPGARLLVIGPAGPLLALPALRPSNLALGMRDAWERMALLCSTPVPDWGLQELALCQVFPVVPATADGLVSLLPQWNTLQSLAPQFWMMKHPEPSLPNLKFRGRKVPPEIITSLRRYLGAGAFRWLCATAYYPELYFELTNLFNDEAIPPQTDFSEWEQNHVWWAALYRLCRLPWFRSGHLPNVFREALRELLPEEDAVKVREQILAVLTLPDNQAQPGSYAETGRAFTVAWLKSEQTTDGKIEDFLPSDASISIEDVEDAIGKKIWQRQTQLPQPEPDGRFRILWVVGESDRWSNMQDRWNERMGTISRQANSVSEAISSWRSEYFELIILESGFQNIPEMTGRLRSEGITTPVVLFDNNQDYGNVSQSSMSYEQQAQTSYSGESLPDGISRIFRSASELESYVSELVQGKYQQQTAGSEPPDEPDEQPFIDQIEKSENLRDALLEIERMKSSGLSPSISVFLALFEKSETYEEARRVNSLMHSEKIAGNLFTYTQLLKKTEEFDDARSVFEEMRSASVRPDKIAWTTYLSKAPEYENARFIFNEMKKEGVETDAVTYTALLDKTRDFYQARTTFEEMLKDGIKPNRGMYTQVMKRAASEEDANWVEEQMRQAGIGEGTIRRVREQFQKGTDEGGRESELDIFKLEAREKITEGVDVTLKLLKERITLDPEKMNRVLLLESQYNETNKQLLRGVISNEDAQLEYNKLRHSLLTLINSLTMEDLDGGRPRRRKEPELEPQAEITRPPELQKVVNELRETLPQGIDLTIDALKKTLIHESDKMSDLIILESRYKDLNRQLLQGTISNEDSQVEFNKLRHDFLNMIDSLTTADLNQGSTDQDYKKIHNGELLYRLPTQMVMQAETKCIVRLAFDRKILIEDFDLQDSDKMKNIRISEVMGVELLDAEGNTASIRSLNEIVQFVDKDLYTEWIFFVTPEKTGNLPLVLKISVIEIQDGVERKRNVVLEEKIQVVEGPSSSQSEFEAASKAYGFDEPPADKKRLKIFLSYARQDSKFIELIQNEINFWSERYDLDIWSEQELKPSENWQEEIQNQLAASDIVLALVSADYLSSKAFEELQSASESVKTIVPVIVRPCIWQETFLAKWQTLPRDGRPLDARKDQDKVLIDLRRELAQLIESQQQRNDLA